MSAALLLQRILFATDFSKPAEYAQRFACELADRFQAELHLLHVIVPLAVPAIGAPAFGYCDNPPIIAELEESTLRGMGTLLDDQWQANHRVVKAVRVGMPIVEIVGSADENQIDLIVMGTLGRTGLRHLLMGSVAANVVRKARCPVLTVRLPDVQETAR